MAVHEFELFHGIVLTKLVRSDRPITLRMIETRPAEAWSAYTLNNEVDLFIKHSTTPRTVARGGGGKSWTFVFGVEQLHQMALSTSKREVYVALVGGDREVKTRDMQVCLLRPAELRNLIDLTSDSPQTLTVRYAPGKRLRLLKERKEKLRIPKNRLDTWDVPGS